MSRRNAPSLLSISARPVALGGTLRSPVRARIPISAASVAATPHSQKRREHEKWAKHRSTISGAPNGHRAFQKRHAWSPLGPPTSPERGGELWGPRASGGSDGKISSEFGLIRTWTRDCMFIFSPWDLSQWVGGGRERGVIFSPPRVLVRCRLRDGDSHPIGRIVVTSFPYRRPRRNGAAVEHCGADLKGKKWAEHCSRHA